MSVLSAPAQDADRDGLSDDEEHTTGTSPFNPDTDGDGLLDGWEVHGLLDRGFEEPLPAYGADPLRKDVFVEVDWMESEEGDATAGARVAYQVAADLVRVFQRSGVNIRLHVDLGPRIESYLPAELREPEIDADAFQVLPDEQKVIPYQEYLQPRPADGVSASLRSLYDIYYGGYYFRPSRRNIFYYVLLAEQKWPGLGAGGLDELDSSSPSTDGFEDELARRDGLCDAGVRLSLVFRRPVPDLSPEWVRYRYSVSVLHELGHAFGLGHGGSLPGYRWDSTNYKPNYPSIMNYRFQFCGVESQAGLPVLDLSRGLLKEPLLESRLMEPRGLGRPPSKELLQCVGFRQAENFVEIYPENIDWNGDRDVSLTAVVTDINQNERIDAKPMVDHDDWGKLAREGFDGIGLNAFRGRELAGSPLDEVTCLPGDFNGDGITDLFLLEDDRLSFAAGTLDGALRMVPGMRGRGSMGSWRIGPAPSFEVADFFGAGREMVFAHREREVAVLELDGELARLRWFEDDHISRVGEEEEDVGWKLSPRDRFLAARFLPGVGARLVVTNGEDLALLCAADAGASRMGVAWSGRSRLEELGRGNYVSLRKGRALEGTGETILVAGGDILLELDASAPTPSLTPLDREGRLPLGPGAGAGDSDWPVSLADSVRSLDLDGDGAAELLLRDGRRLGVAAWKDGSARVLWSVTGSLPPGGVLQGDWPLSETDRVYQGQFVAGGGEEVLVSSGQKWVTLAWDEGSSSLRAIGQNEDSVSDGLQAWELRRGQALFPGRFLPESSDVILVQEERSIFLARLEDGAFRPVLRFDARLGEWGIEHSDKLFAANFDTDPELELLARKGSTYGVLDLWPVPRCSFLASLDHESLSFVDVPRFLRGDANGDGDVDISDVVTVLGSLFLGFERPACEDAADTNDSGAIDISDAISLLWFLFDKGTSPPEPGPFRLGIDPTPDKLTCASPRAGL